MLDYLSFEVDGEVFEVDVVYESLPAFCTACNNIGHNLGDCRLVARERQAKEAKIKTTQVVRQRTQQRPQEDGEVNGTVAVGEQVMGDGLGGKEADDEDDVDIVNADLEGETGLEPKQVASSSRNSGEVGENAAAVHLIEANSSMNRVASPASNDRVEGSHPVGKGLVSSPHVSPSTAVSREKATARVGAKAASTPSSNRFEPLRNVDGSPVKWGDLADEQGEDEVDSLAEQSNVGVSSMDVRPVEDMVADSGFQTVQHKKKPKQIVQPQSQRRTRAGAKKLSQ